MIAFLQLSMIFMSFLADFRWQGELANYKQKKWWEDNYPAKLYVKCWICALIIHSVWWAISIMIPQYLYLALLYFCKGVPVGSVENIGYLFAILALVNTIIHAIVDHFKCNNLRINFWVDQSIHLIQVMLTAACCYIIIHRTIGTLLL